MPCPHYSIKISTRSKSPPTTAQAAYQSGERLFDERTHRTKNYKEKRGVIYTEILLPENAPKEYGDRNTLWNAVEKAETNWNAQTARRFEIALPKELPPDIWREMIRTYVQEQFVNKGMIADLAIHDPDPPDHNPHAHVMLTMRAMDEKGHWLPKSRREYELDENGSRIRDEDGQWKFRKVFTTDWDDHENAERWRQSWEDLQNRYLEAADRPERISMKSYERQGIDQIPTVHMGPSVAAMERRGIETNIGNLNREIKKTNGLITAFKRAINRIIKWLSELKEGIREIEMEPKEIFLADLLSQRFNRRQKAASVDPERFAAITDYMRECCIFSVEDLDTRASEISADAQPIRDRIKAVTARTKTIRKLLENGDRRAQLSPIHDQYLKIHWKGKKEQFAKEHKEELDAWNQADRYLKRYMPDQTYDADPLQSELSSLNDEMDELNVSLRSLQEETQTLKDIRLLVKELLPEFEPEGETITKESRDQRQKTVKESLTDVQSKQERSKRKHKDRDGR